MAVMDRKEKILKRNSSVLSLQKRLIWSDNKHIMIFHPGKLTYTYILIILQTTIIHSISHWTLLFEKSLSRNKNDRDIFYTGSVVSLRFPGAIF